MSRVIKCAHIQMSNALSDGSVAEIKQAMIEKHLPMVKEAGENRCNNQELGFCPSGLKSANG